MPSGLTLAPGPADVLEANDARRLGLPLADGAPVFAEPWQAQAFAVVVQLSRQGVFGWAEWVATLSQAIADHPATAGEAAEAAYYRQWLHALETVLTGKNLASAAELSEREDAWRQAYLNTPHGQPVELGAAEHDDDAHDGHSPLHHQPHDHHAHHATDHTGTAKRPGPVAVSPAVSRP